MLSYDGKNNQPLHLANIDFSFAKISSLGTFLELHEQYSQTVGWSSMNEWLGCGLPMTTYPSFTMPQ